MKKIAFIYIFILFSYTCFAQNIEDFFINIPNHYLTTSSDQRRELIDKVKSGKDSTIQNNYGGFSKLLVFDSSNNYIKVQTSEQGFLETKGWMLADSTFLYALSFWVCSPACDGEILFFNNNYFSGISQKMPEIGIADFFNKDSLQAKGISENDLKNRFDISFIRFEFKPESDTILAINDNHKYLNKDDYATWKSCLKGNQLPLIWENGYFEKGEAYFKEE